MGRNGSAGGAGSDGGTAVGGILNAATGALTIKISIVNGWARAATVVTRVLRRSLKVTSSIPLAGLAPRRAEPE